ncbi:MAG: hypothetical protein II797_01800, partial [Clostridia bacterium]|nr:hypothetical protein [Clostridia bacterium]
TLLKKRVTLLCGHYGSGKTNIAVALALALRERYDRVAVADLDIVNPYFRTRDSEELFREKDIRLIVSEYANTNLDAPAMPQEMYAIIHDRTLRCVVDVGGDDRGALALGRLSDALREENDYDMFLVVNRYRPLTRDVPSVMDVRREIEEASHLPFTGIINNSNLAAGTTPAHVLDSLEFAREVEKQTGLPLVGTSVESSLYETLRDDIPFPLSLTLQKRPV